MTSRLVVAEREKYADLWGVDVYRDNSPGLRFLPIFESLVERRLGDRSLLDAGCGDGRAGLALAQAGYRVTLCDLTDAGLVPEAERLTFVPAVLWHSLVGQGTLRWYDYVFCCDVLEHLPTAYVGLAVQRLLEVTGTGAFFSVSLVQDVHGPWVGAPLHQTVQPFAWWRDLFRELGEVIDARDLYVTATYYVRRAAR